MNGSPIRQLPDHLVNQIAAGEVVERPAAVVKELVENALDAGAHSISIRLEDAGKTLIEVVDDGAGMDPEQMALAIQRHATSKLPDGDLQAIATRGFRGEALPSIASVSDFTLTSRMAGADSAWSIGNSGGTWGDPKPSAAGPGTRVRVERLFARTPARLKFLRSDSAERTAVKQVVTHLALSAPGIAVRLSEAGRNLLDLPSDPDTRLIHLMGRDFADAHVHHVHQRGEIEVEVLAGLPTLNRATSAGLVFLVNHRPVEDRRLLGVVRAAYRDFVPKGRFPSLVAHIKLPPHEVDINVHPAKTEVRFRDPASVSAALMGALKAALDQAPSGSSAHLSGALQASLRPSFSTVPRSPIPGTPAPSAHQTRMALQAQAPLPSTPPSIQAFEEPAAPSQAFDPDQPLGTPIALLHKTYIISQTRDGFCLVDMHAAHERLVYEQLKAAHLHAAIPRQALLVPAVVSLDANSLAALTPQIEALAKLGLVIEAFGDDTILVREVPALLADKADWAQMLKDIAEVLLTEGSNNPLDTQLHETLAKLACYTSVRSGRALNLSEMDTLLRQMEAEPASAQCNHGRPTSINLSLRDLERLFERSG